MDGAGWVDGLQAGHCQADAGSAPAGWGVGRGGGGGAESGLAVGLGQPARPAYADAGVVGGAPVGVQQRAPNGFQRAQRLLGAGAGGRVGVGYQLPVLVVRGVNGLLDLDTAGIG